MTLQEFENAYLGRKVSMKKIGDQFRYLGKFGKSIFYQFSFVMNSYNIATDVCIDQETITGLVPEKEAVANEWGEMPEECDELTDEEISVMIRYLEGVLLTEAELAAAAAAARPTVMGADFELFVVDDEDEEEDED